MFKKGCECRFDLPAKVQHCADIHFASDKEAVWFYVDGPTKKSVPSNTLQKETLVTSS